MAPDSAAMPVNHHAGLAHSFLFVFLSQAGEMVPLAKYWLPKHKDLNLDPYCSWSKRNRQCIPIILALAGQTGRFLEFAGQPVWLNQRALRFSERPCLKNDVEND